MACAYLGFDLTYPVERPCPTSLILPMACMSLCRRGGYIRTFGEDIALGDFAYLAFEGGPCDRCRR
jgi:hypothetical protein